MNPSSFDARAMPSVLTLGPRSFVPALAIFDKDGTLIDFHAMWGRWIVELARRLEAATDHPVSDRLFRAMGFELVSGRVLAEGPLAVAPMANLRSLAVEVLAAAGLSPSMAQAVVDVAWHAPSQTYLLSSVHCGSTESRLPSPQPTTTIPPTRRLPPSGLLGSSTPSFAATMAFHPSPPPTWC